MLRKTGNEDVKKQIRTRILKEENGGTYIDLLERPTVTASMEHYFFHTCRPSVRTSPIFKRSEYKTNQMKTVISIGGTVDLAKGIINDTCLVLFLKPDLKQLMQDQTFLNP